MKKYSALWENLYYNYTSKVIKCWNKMKWWKILMIDFTNCKEELNSYKGSEKKKTLI